MYKTKRLLSIFVCLATSVLLTAPVAWGAPALSTTALTLSTTSVPLRTPVTLTALVLSGATPVVPGLVTFEDGKVVLGSAQLLTNGTAALTVRLGPGIHEITANFAGTKSYAKSSSGQQGLLVSGPFTTQTAITSSGSAGSYTLTGTVDTSGLAAPTGTISFTDQANANLLGMVALDPGTLVQGFQTQGTYDNGSVISDVVAGDFNGDGVPDLVATSGVNVRVRLGLGDGTFQQQPVIYNAGAIQNGIVAADFNGDGMLDLALADTPNLGVLLGNGDGTFQLHVMSTSGSNFAAIAVGDFNNDGVPDLVFIEPLNTGFVVLGNGDGTFQTGINFNVGGAQTALLGMIAVGDFNGDGLLDIAVDRLDDGTVNILLGNGDGTFQPDIAFAAGAAFLAVGDFNGDGVLDLAVADYNDEVVSVLLGKGDGTFSPGVTYNAGSGPTAVNVGDFNGDGKPDLAVTNSASNTVGVFLGNGDGTFQKQVTFGTDFQPTVIGVGDFDGDGIQDLAVGTYEGIDVLLNSLTESATLNNVSVTGTGSHQVMASYNGDATHLASSSAWIPVTATQIATMFNLSASQSIATSEQSITFSAVLSPFASASLNTNGESISFFNNGFQIGTGTLLNGMATLNFSALPVGQDSITAAYLGDSNFMPATANAVMVTVSPASDFTVTVTPPTETAFRGRVAGFLLELKSLNGFNGKVTLSCSGGPTGSHCVDFPTTISVKNTAYAISGVFFPATTPPGTYTITFTAVSGTITHTATAKFTVK